MGFSERPKPLTPVEQVRIWLVEGETLQTLARKIRTPAIKDEIQRQLVQQATEARAPKANLTTAVVCGGG